MQEESGPRKKSKSEGKVLVARSIKRVCLVGGAFRGSKNFFTFEGGVKTY